MNRSPVWQVAMWGWGTATVALLIGCWVVYGQHGSKSTKPRVPPKVFKPGDDTTFFEDVFTVVGGQRPILAPGGQGAAASALSGSLAGSSSGSNANSGGAVIAGSGWAKLIAAETIEDEVKAIKSILDRTVTTPSDFAGKGYKICRTQFTELAVLFAVISEYDGTVRWKADAAAARDAFARTAANCKVGSTQAFNEVKQRKTDLDDLIRGSSLQRQAEAPETDWGAICDRSPLMIRLETGFDGNIRPYTSNAGDFQSNKEKIAAEAQLIAVIAEVLCKPSMEDAGDSTYSGFARKMQTEALRVWEATKTGDFEQARQAVGQIGQACSLCHESYRG